MPSSDRQEFVVLRVEVAGSWAADDFGWLLRDLSRLEVVRVHYESPGSVDVTGLGKVLEEVRRLVEVILNYRTKRERDGLEIEAMKIENARNLIRLAGEARDYGMPPEGIRGLLYEVGDIEDRLLRQVEIGNITAIGPAPPVERVG